MIRKLSLAALALVCLAASARAVEVATVGDAAVVIPWGPWVVAIAQTVTSVLVPLIVTAIGAGLAKIFPPIRMLITDALIESTLRKWLDYGMNEAAGAARGQVLTVNVGSAVIASALNRAFDRANVSSISAWVLKQAGGETEVAKKLFRMLHLEPAATAETVIAPALAKVGSGT